MGIINYQAKRNERRKVNAKKTAKRFGCEETHRSVQKLFNFFLNWRRGVGNGDCDGIKRTFQPKISTLNPDL